MPHQELKIIDPNTGKNRAARRDPARSASAATMVMAGYDNNPEADGRGGGQARLAALGRHWARWTSEGYVQITGRSKNMVIRGGENLYPREIEEFLHTLDFVVDAQVVGVPDQRLGEELLACLRLHGPAAQNPPTPEELRALCKGRIAHFKIPRYWKVVDEYPMTITGKVQKFKLRELAERELAAGTLPDSKVQSAPPPEPVAS